MKLTIEIKDTEFLFNYEVGSSKHNSKSEISTEKIMAFSEMLKLCHEVEFCHHEKFKKEITAKVWIAENPLDAAKELKKEAM